MDKGFVTNLLDGTPEQREEVMQRFFAWVEENLGDELKKIDEEFEFDENGLVEKMD